MAAVFLRALALATTLACCAAWAVQGEDPNVKIGPHEVLIRVIRVNNGTVDLDVRDVPGKGRGLVAFRDMAKNQVAVHLPKAMAFQLAPVTKALEVRPPPTIHPTLPSPGRALVPVQRCALAPAVFPALQSSTTIHGWQGGAPGGARRKARRRCWSPSTRMWRPGSRSGGTRCRAATSSSGAASPFRPTSCRCFRTSRWCATFAKSSFW